MASKAARRVNKPFDPAKFETLVEPFQVRVEKEKGGSRSKIPLPRGEDGSDPGENLSKAAILGLEEWLVNKWSGGGFYIITVTDSSVPTPQVMDWDIWYSPQEFPEKTPPSLAEAAGLPPIVPLPVQHAQAATSSAAPVTTLPFPLPPQVSDMAPPPTAFPHGLPLMHSAQPMTTPRPQQGSVFDPTWSGWYAQLAAAPTPPRNDEAIERRRLEEELRRKDDELRKRDLEAAQARHAADLERERREAEASRQKLERELSELRQAIVTAPPKTNDAETALKAELAQMRAEREADKREADRERRERDLKDLIAKQNDDHRREMEEMRRASEENLRRITEQLANTAKGPDPMLTMIQSIQRDTMEAMKEMSRNHQAALEKLQANIMHPREMMALVKENSSSIDSVTRQMAQTYTSIFDLNQRAVEQMMQIGSAGQTDAKVALAEKAMEKLSSLGERYFGGKAKVEVAEQQSKAQMASAQAQAMSAQAQAMAAQAAMQQRQAASGQAGVTTQAVPPKPAPVPQPGPQAPTAPPQAGIVTSTVATTVGVGTGIAAAQPAPSEPVPANAHAEDPTIKRHGRTDAEWFGLALSEIAKLRAEVDKFLDAVANKRLNEDGTIDGLDPLQCVLVMDQAIAQIHAAQIVVPALEELLKRGQVDRFVDVLLPHAPHPYKLDVVQLLVRALNGEDLTEQEDDDEDAQTGEQAPAQAAPVNGTTSAAPVAVAPVAALPTASA